MCVAIIVYECSSPFTTTNLFREHVYRRHARPVLCSRCYLELENDEALAAHTRLEVPCRIVEAEPLEVEGYTKEQEKRLRSRKRPSGKTERDRWVDMYQILFPNDSSTSIPDPCMPFSSSNSYRNILMLNTDYELEATQNKHLSTGSEEFARYQEFSRTELPRLVQQNIQEWVMQRSVTLEEDLKSGLPELVRNCQEILFQSFRQSSLPETHSALDPGDDTKQTSKLEFVAPQSPIPEGHDMPSFEQIERYTGNTATYTTTIDSGYSSIGYPMTKQISTPSTSEMSITTGEIEPAGREGSLPTQNNEQYQTPHPFFPTGIQPSSLGPGRSTSDPRTIETNVHSITNGHNLTDSSTKNGNIYEIGGIYEQVNDLDFSFFDDLSTCDSHVAPSMAPYDVTTRGPTSAFHLGGYHG
jgi:hypothetical protein